MALSYSVNKVGKDGRELLSYGNDSFPIAFFDDDLTKVTVPWHWHDEFEIVIIKEGKVKVKIANSDFILNKGDGYFTNGGILHSAVLESETGHQHCLVFSAKVIGNENDIVWDSYIEPIMTNQLLSFIKLSSDIPWQKEILALSDSAWSDGAFEQKDYAINVKFNLGKIFSIIINHLDMLTSESIYTDKVQRDELRIKKMLNFIKNNYPSRITIENIAKSADISVSTCLRLFKDVMKATPIQYLLEYRIQKIVEALETPSGKSISEIAYSCGFPDATYFNRCFKKIYGCTPTEYINNIT